MSGEGFALEQLVPDGYTQRLLMLGVGGIAQLTTVGSDHLRFETAQQVQLIVRVGRDIPSGLLAIVLDTWPGPGSPGSRLSLQDILVLMPDVDAFGVSPAQNPHDPCGWSLSQVLLLPWIDLTPRTEGMTLDEFSAALTGDQSQGTDVLGIDRVFVLTTWLQQVVQRLVEVSERVFSGQPVGPRPLLSLYAAHQPGIAELCAELTQRGVVPRSVEAGIVIVGQTTQAWLELRRDVDSGGLCVDLEAWLGVSKNPQVALSHLTRTRPLRQSGFAWGFGLVHLEPWTVVVLEHHLLLPVVDLTDAGSRAVVARLAEAAIADASPIANLDA